MSYYLSRMLPVAFDEAVALTVDALKKEGFGVITEIDVKQTLKEKIGVDFSSYRILGTCNPALASKARSARCCPATSWSAMRPRANGSGPP